MAAKHDAVILDLAFALDCTGSMGSYIETAQDNIRNIVDEIVAADNSDIHLALVEFRDHPPQEESFVTRTHDFTPSVKTMKGWLDGCSAVGGGDPPEAVADALYDVLNLSWRKKATKICILITDAPPHGLSGESGDKFPNGCPKNIDLVKVVRYKAQKGITLYTVGCGSINHSTVKEFYTAIAYITGGQYVSLNDAECLTRVIIGGAQEEMSLEKWMKEVHIEVTAEMNARGDADIDEDAVCLRVQEVLKSKGARTKQLQRNKVVLAAPSSFAYRMSRTSTFIEINIIYKEEVLRLTLMSTGRSLSRDDDVCEHLFEAIDGDIHMEQVRRMVQKSKMRNMLKPNFDFSEVFCSTYDEHVILDLAFAMDCTASMRSYIKTAQDNIRNIVDEIVAADNSDIHLALVEFRDHPPQEESFVTRTHDFTPSVKTMKGWLDGCSAVGGGDPPEAVADALYDVLNLSWRKEATKICILITDAPPHGLSGESGDEFPNGCPENIDPVDVVRSMAQKGITLYTVGCGNMNDSTVKEFYTAIAHITGGQYVSLNEAKSLTRVIIGGAQEEMSLEKWMKEVHIEVTAEMKARGDADIDEDAVCLRVQDVLKSKGARTKQLQRNKVMLAAPSSLAYRMSRMRNFSELNATYDPSYSPENEDTHILISLGHAVLTKAKEDVTNGCILS